MGRTDPRPQYRPDEKCGPVSSPVFAAGKIRSMICVARSLPRRSRRVGPCLALLPCLSLASAVRAGEADIVAAEATCDGDSMCRFSVTVRHADEGWDHYANRWEVLTESGEVLATRVLRHPHVSEQPFTRDLPGVKLPEEIQRVRFRAHDSVHEFGGREVVVELSRGD